MQRRNYESEWDYTEELLQLVREKMKACRTVQSLFEEGYPAGGIAAYERQQEVFREQMRSMEERGREAVQKGLMLPLEYLYRVFEADDFLRHCVMLALAPELDGELGKEYAGAEENQGQEFPSLKFCIHSYTLDPERQSRILRSVYAEREKYESFFGNFGTGRYGSLNQVLRLEERIRLFLFQVEAEDPKLRGFCRLSFPGELKDRPMLYGGEQAVRLAGLLGRRPAEERVYYLYGPEGAGKQFLVRHAHRELGRLCLFVQAGGFSEEEHGTRIGEILREALLRRAGLCICDFHLLFEEWKEYEIAELLETFLNRLPYVILLSEKEWPYGRGKVPGGMLELSLPVPDMGRRIRLWESAFSRERLPEMDLEGLAAKFSFTPGKIEASVREALRQARWREKPVDEEILYEACRRQISHKLGEKASRIKASYTWEDLVLPPFQKSRLKNACDQIVYHHTVYETWGFQEKLPYGRGVSMLFYGPPGTGKTMGAQVIAGTLHLELYKVDLSAVMSKYIGETEKNLDCIFEEVKKSRSILFFDEADALFGKRSEVKDAQDKYANAETAYLLQKIEEYEGIVILASNYLQNFDEAFKRRIKFMIEFPLPDRERRREIWERVYPKAAPLDEDLDFDYLAGQFELSGSSIKNIASASAFLAAAERRSICMRHVLFALTEELRKSGKLLQREEFGEYGYMIEALFR